MLERQIESVVVKWARALGWRVKKMNGVGDRGWPDRLFVGPGFTAFIEFKKPGARLTPLQEVTIEELAELGQNVAWFADAREAIDWLKALAAKSLSAQSDALDAGARRRRAVSRPRSG